MKNRVHPFRLSCCGALLAVFFLVSFSGCVNLQPTEDVTRHYALGAASGSLSLSPTVAQPALYIARPNLPSYLEGPNLQFRSGDGAVRSLGSARWVEPLDQGVARALGELMLESGSVVVRGYYPWPAASRKTPQLKVDLYRFGARADGAIELSARWQIVAGDGTVERQGQFSAEGLQWRVGDSASLVAGLNQALVQLVAEMFK